MAGSLVALNNCLPRPLPEIPLFKFDEFCEAIRQENAQGSRVISFWGTPDNSGTTTLYLLLGNDKSSALNVIGATVDKTFTSLTTALPQLHLFEREIFEQWGVKPQGHPWLKPLRHQTSNRKCTIAKQADKILPSVTRFFKIDGEEIHEVAVGPVHAGIIEPGHFRFQCHGETVFHLEISLGYQHRGIEKALVGGPNQRTIHYMETLSGDTTIGHSLAYCQAVEGLSDAAVPLRAVALRGIMLELERLANHTGDLGALANDVGYLPTSSYCGRLRGELLNITASICGNRFGRTMIQPGGVAHNVDKSLANRLSLWLTGVYKDLKNAVSLLFGSTLVVDRFEDTGVLLKATAAELGLVGVAARSCGIEQDVRFDFPTGIFKYAQIPPSTHSTGDVFSRAFVRWLEIQRSLDFIQHQLAHLPAGPIAAPIGQLKEQSMIVSLIEGWRGEICHIAITDENGQFVQYKITDPSFHNWTGLAMAMRGEEISNFPLCNKSFNLSYCGVDL